MASEKQVNILMQLLDESLAEVDTIEGKLSSYEEMLQSVKEQMDQISQSNRLIQISNTNNGKLLDEIQFLVVKNKNIVGIHLKCHCNKSLLKVDDVCLLLFPLELPGPVKGTHQSIAGWGPDIS